MNLKSHALHLTRFLIPSINCCGFLLCILFGSLSLSNGFAEAESKNVLFNNKFKLYMARDPCNDEVAYRANRQYEDELRVFVKPLRQGGYILSLPFKGNTYNINLRDEAEAGLKIWQEELDSNSLRYRFVSNFSEANVLIITGVTGDASMGLSSTLGLSFTKGGQFPILKNYLERYGLYLKVGGVIIPDREYLEKVLRVSEHNYDLGIKNGSISKEVSPEMYLKMIFRFTFVHELGHVIGFEHAFLTSMPNENSNSTVLIKDRKSYDLQPPVMLPHFEVYILRYQLWKKAGLASPDAILPSLQEIDTFNFVQDSIVF